MKHVKCPELVKQKRPEYQQYYHIGYCKMCPKKNKCLAYKEIEGGVSSE